MTPREKAEELYEAYFYCIPSFTDEGSIEHNTAKKCALTAVYEILSAINVNTGNAAQGRLIQSLNNYWTQVKQEIEKL